MKIARIIGVFLLLVVVGLTGLSFITRLPDTAGLKNYYFERQNLFERDNISIMSRLASGQPIDTQGNEDTGYLRLQASSDPGIAIHYYTHQRGFGVGAFGTGIAYLEQQPDKIYSSLEQMTASGESMEGLTRYGLLSGNWYYFRWALD